MPLGMACINRFLPQLSDEYQGFCFLAFCGKWFKKENFEFKATEKSIHYFFPSNPGILQIISKRNQWRDMNVDTRNRDAMKETLAIAFLFTVLIYVLYVCFYMIYNIYICNNLMKKEWVHAWFIFFINDWTFNPSNQIPEFSLFYNW